MFRVNKFHCLFKCVNPVDPWKCTWRANIGHRRRPKCKIETDPTTETTKPLILFKRSEKSADDAKFHHNFIFWSIKCKNETFNNNWYINRKFKPFPWLKQKLPFTSLSLNIQPGLLANIRCQKWREGR